ncbi:MAG: E3 binding domain-containing protein, partial [Rhodobacteraceae bacterium]|nr:E3 binding domain-containing protein [Paracoccaceae bacterium]
MSIEVRVPTLGESVTEATIATWFKQPGDAVAVDEMLCELETDKVTVEVPAPAAGTLAEIVVAAGETVGVNALLATISEGAAAAKPAKSDQAPAPAAVTRPPNPVVTSAPEPAPEPAPETAPEPATATGGESVDVMVPALGESVSEATVATWFKAVGDTVALDEMLCELETDKVSVEVPAPSAGVLAEIVAPAGTTVAAAAKLAVISASGAAPATAAEPAATETAPSPSAKADVEDAPSAKKMMAEAGLSRDDVTGTGRDGRVMKGDVQKALADAPAAAATPA